MRQILNRVLSVICFAIAISGVTLGQSNATKTEANDKYLADVLTELRLTRKVIQQLQKELRQLQVGTIRIRIEQDTIAAKEIRLESIRSTAAVTQDALEEVQDRIKRLEALDSPDLEDAERQRLRVEIADGKRERDRTRQKLDALSYLDTQLSSEIQTDRARLADMIAALEAISPERVSEAPETHVNPSGPGGSRNK